MDIREIAAHFAFRGGYVSGKRYGSGHINESYKVDCERESYILQKINTKLFKDVEGLMNNISGVLSFAAAEVEARGGNPRVECMTLIPTSDGKNYYEDGEGGYWRAYLFISQGVGYDLIENPMHFYASGVAFGKFQRMLARFDASKLVEVLPDFHNTRKRFGDFRRAAEFDVCGRAGEVAAEIEFVRSREAYADRVVDLLGSGEMPTRVTHNDTKLNNVLIDPVTGRAVCVIDLDTIMPGSVLYDFGDSIRFGANHSAEDEPDLSKVNFDPELFELYTRGFVGEVGETLTETEVGLLAFGAVLMTYECGMRFLADYLEGDVYFRTHRPGQNLDRARTQFKLVSDMEAQLGKMNEIVRRYCAK